MKKYIKRGRLHTYGTMFPYLLILNTYFPNDWVNEFARAMEYLISNYELGNASSYILENEIVKARFYITKYVLGCYDWDVDMGCAREHLPRCYGFTPSFTVDDYVQNIQKFKVIVFPKMWCNVMVHVEDQTYVVFSDLIENLKESISGKIFGVLTDPTEWKDPFLDGVSFKLLDEITAFSDFRKKDVYRPLDILSFLFSCTYKHKLRDYPLALGPEWKDNIYACPQIDDINLKSTKIQQCAGTCNFIWILQRGRKNGKLHTYNVEIRNKVSNSLRFFTVFIQKYATYNANNTTPKWVAIRDKLYELGILKTEVYIPPFLLSANIRDFKYIDKKKRKREKKKQQKVVTTLQGNLDIQQSFVDRDGEETGSGNTTQDSSPTNAGMPEFPVMDVTISDAGFPATKGCRSDIPVFGQYYQEYPVPEFQVTEDTDLEWPDFIVTEDFNSNFGSGAPTLLTDIPQHMFFQ